MCLYEKALKFATSAHEGQFRKYDPIPYIHHPIAVAEIVATYVKGYTEEMLAAAILHDVIEDCGVTEEDLSELFPESVVNMVSWLSNPSKNFPELSRKERKKMDEEKLAKAPVEVMTIKLADLIHNSKTIIEMDPNFAKVWMAEKKSLVSRFEKGDPTLYMMAKEIVNNYFKE